MGRDFEKDEAKTLRINPEVILAGGVGMSAGTLLGMTAMVAYDVKTKNPNTAVDVGLLLGPAVTIAALGVAATSFIRKTWNKSQQKAQRSAVIEAEVAALRQQLDAWADEAD